MDNYSDQVVMVTGAVGNLATAVVRGFLSADAKLALLDRKRTRLQVHYPDLANTANYLFIEGVDVTIAEDVESAVFQAIDHFGRIDVLVNTAGGYRPGVPIHETSLDTWELLMNLNATSVFLCCRAVIPHMLERGYGKIINIAAKSGLVGTAKLAAYSAAKSAVIRLTESMSAELKPQGINVNCILPGIIDTPPNRQAMPKADFRRWVTPESLTKVILFLASSAAQDIHGAAIPVSGFS